MPAGGSSTGGGDSQPNGELAGLIGAAAPAAAPRPSVVVAYHHMDHSPGGWEVALPAIECRLTDRGISHTLIGHLDSRISRARAVFVFAREPDRERASIEAAIASVLAVPLPARAPRAPGSGGYWPAGIRRTAAGLP